MLSSFDLSRWAKTGGTLYVKIEPSIVGAFTISFFRVMGQSNWLVAKEEKKA
jgi:hypothetical protein